MLMKNIYKRKKKTKIISVFDCYICFSNILVRIFLWFFKKRFEWERDRKIDRVLNREHEGKNRWERNFREKQKKANCN